MAYKASIELLIDVNSEAEACDAVAETLREHMRAFAPTSVFVDWRYATAKEPVEIESIPADFSEDSDWPKEI